MDSKKTLDTLGAKLKAVDLHLVHLLARRIRLSEEVAMVKIEGLLPMQRLEIERNRIDQVRKLAEQLGLNPDFVQAILYAIIGESCKAQAALMDDNRLGGKAEKFAPSLEDLRANLLTLTDSLAPNYDAEYGVKYPATLALNEFERRLITSSLHSLPDRALALDVGCATGREMRWLSSHFTHLRGMDISPRMVEYGRLAVEHEGLKNVSFDVHDIETTWPVESGSVSLVIMNGGTGSDVLNLPFVLLEIQRVLKPHGRFVISFYNKESWTQRVFMPWPLCLAAGVDQDRGCLEVRLGNRLIPIYAKPYTSAELEEMVPNHLAIVSSSTYPTLASVLPVDVLGAIDSDGSIKRLDDFIVHEEGSLGAYVVIHGEKV